MSGVVYRPQGPHSCDLPGGIETIGEDYRKGTVWRCDCGTTWVSQGITGGGLQRSGGYASGGLEWKREGKRARRKREHNTPFAWPAGGAERTAVATRPEEPATHAGHVAKDEPPRGVTVTDRHGQRWIRIGAVWVIHDLSSAVAPWDVLRNAHGPLHTTWSDGPPCPEQQPHAPVE